MENRIGKDVLYKDQIDYVCLRGFVFNETVTRRRLICDLYNGSVYTTWNGTELNCSSKWNNMLSNFALDVISQ